MASRRRFSDEERKIRRREASRKAGAKWRKANPELAKQKSKAGYTKWKATNFEQARPKIRQKQNEWHQKNPDKRRQYNYKRKYGITLAEYEAMVVAQGGRCAICRTDSPGKKRGHWCVDHCHETKTVRKLLCHMCNKGLGDFRHDVILLQTAIDYLHGSLNSDSPVVSDNGS